MTALKPLLQIRMDHCWRAACIAGFCGIQLGVLLACGAEKQAPLAPDPEQASEQVQGDVERFVDAPSGLRMRSEPNRTAQTVQVVPHGRAVQIVKRSSKPQTIYGTSDHWYQIR